MHEQAHEGTELVAVETIGLYALCSYRVLVFADGGINFEELAVARCFSPVGRTVFGHGETLAYAHGHGYTDCFTDLGPLPDCWARNHLLGLARDSVSLRLLEMEMAGTK